MQLFIAESLRKLTEELSSVTLGDEPSSGAAAEQILDVSGAEEIIGGSFVFPATGDDSEPDWCVLALPTRGTAQRHVFCLRGRLRAGLKPEDFVARAYELILMRGVDETGRSIYPDLLGRFVLSRRDVLKILLESTEAQSRDTRFIVIPDPSPWLSQLGVLCGVDASFPAMTLAAHG